MSGELRADGICRHGAQSALGVIRQPASPFSEIAGTALHQSRHDLRLAQILVASGGGVEHAGALLLRKSELVF